MSTEYFDSSNYSSQNDNQEQNQTHNNKYFAFTSNENTDIPTNTKVTQEAKEKRINMAFTDSNYAFILSETSKLEINFMYFINHIISSTTTEEINKYFNSQPLRRGKNSAPRRKGHKQHRINLKFSNENYTKCF